MRQASMEDAPPIEDEDEEPTSEHVDGLELIFGRGRSGYKDVYPHEPESRGVHSTLSSGEKKIPIPLP